ncbi:MAG: DUF5058 family protein [Oscillospiraceae bacterium]|nr:DUF5058 family protein [Oscillospiraceae bacterium]
MTDRQKISFAFEHNRFVSFCGLATEHYLCGVIVAFASSVRCTYHKVTKNKKDPAEEDHFFPAGFWIFVSALIMCVCGLLVKKAKIAWLENYAMPFSMLLSMAFAVIVAPLFGV